VKINLVRDLYDDEEILEVLPVDPADVPPPRTEAIETLWGLFEVLLKAPGRLDPFVRDPKLRGKLIAGFTAIVGVVFALHGLILSLFLATAPAGAVPGILSPGWSGTWGSGVALCAAYPVGLLLATLLCLPSYLYLAVLGGTRMTLGEVLAQSLKGKAATAVLHVGLLPIYAVVMLSLRLLVPSAELLALGLYVGLVLPFFVGLRGALSIYAGLRSTVNALPWQERKRRYAVPGWLVMAWALLFTLAAPLALFELWKRLSAVLS
jgi:hypothetical protein